MLTNYRKNKKKMHSLVGTPDYIAPEVFNRTGYTEIIDWWSVGAILFEMLVGYAPFCSENPKETCRKVIQWKKYLNFPSNVSVPREAADLIMKLMADESRLGLLRHQTWQKWSPGDQRSSVLQEHRLEDDQKHDASLQTSSRSL
jgi:serine/threonine protein kinase